MKIRYFEIELSKRRKRVNFIFLINLVPFNGKDYKIQKRPAKPVTSLPSGSRKNVQKFIY